MFRSLASSLITFFAVLLFAFTVLFLWSGSEGIKFKRVAMEGDRSTVGILEEQRRKNMRAQDIPTDTEKMDEPEPEPVRSGPGDGPPVVVWISIPGFRGDYIEKSETPFFDELMANGGSTNKMRPSFPCLTYPAHATMATGKLPAEHGIIADKIRTGPGEVIDNPMDPDLLLAEPIWTTATRQGIKTLVHDWPLSQNQKGEHAAAHFLTDFDPALSDEERLNKVLEAWRASSGGGADAAPAGDGDEEPAADGDAAPAADGDAPAPAAGGDKLRLVMLRLDDILKAGLANGPREAATYEAIAKTDTALKSFYDTLQEEWATLAPPAANLIFFITTDHGLAELDKNVNIAHLLGDEMMQNADIIAHDAIANLYFKDLPENEGEKKIFIDKFDGELSKRIYFRTIKKEELPEEWKYNSDRTGDRILVLKTGYAFVEEKAAEPVFDPSEGPGFFGGFGYPVGESIRMSGQTILAGFPNAPASGTLDEIGQLSFHATVCKLLGIQPAEGAVTDTLPVN
jgi:hypothetical protein